VELAGRRWPGALGADGWASAGDGGRTADSSVIGCSPVLAPLGQARAGSATTHMLRTRRPQPCLPVCVLGVGTSRGRAVDCSRSPNLIVNFPKRKTRRGL